MHGLPGESPSGLVESDRHAQGQVVDAANPDEILIVRLRRLGNPSVHGGAFNPEDLAEVRDRERQVMTDSRNSLGQTWIDVDAAPRCVGLGRSCCPENNLKSRRHREE